MYLFINKYLLFKINRSNFLVCFLFLKTLMHWVFVAACRSFSGGMWTLSWDMWHLVPWPEIEPGHPTLGAWSLSHWTTRQVPQKQKFIFLLFLRGRTFRDHFDQMRKLGLSLNLVKLLDLSKPQFPPLLLLFQRVFTTNHSQSFTRNDNQLNRISSVSSCMLCFCFFP